MWSSKNLTLPDSAELCQRLSTLLHLHCPPVIAPGASTAANLHQLLNLKSGSRPIEATALAVALANLKRPNDPLDRRRERPLLKTQKLAEKNARKRDHLVAEMRLMRGRRKPHLLDFMAKKTRANSAHFIHPSCLPRRDGPSQAWKDPARPRPSSPRLLHLA
jgi:hypothetical protein